MYHNKLKSNIIKWWQFQYIPTVRKIFPGSLERELYEQSLLEDSQNLIHNKSYNATTHAMSGEYGKGILSQEEMDQLDSILKSNYSSVAGIDAISSENTNDDLQASSSDDYCLPKSEFLAKQEQLKRANEIYERLLREAREDEEKKQQEIENAKNLNEPS